MTTALILSGGGARAAYQVGVLKALAELLPENCFTPFPIICGTSAGAINTLSIVGRPGTFRERVAGLEYLWRNIAADKIYRTDFSGVTSNSLRLLASFFCGDRGVAKPVALLDNTPLRGLLRNHIQFRVIDEAIASHHLQAVALTAMSYTTGQSITFFQGDHDNWHRARRMGLRTGLTLDHLLASLAIPTLFAPVKIGERFYGDGALRQLKPLSPALHLGANRIFVIGVSDNPMHRGQQAPQPHSPTLAQMISHMLNSAFVDTIESDLETLEAINQLTQAVSDDERADYGIYQRAVDHICITPSEPINALAEQFAHELPFSVRAFLRLTGANARGGGSGSSAISYLLFEPGFCGYLIDMGYRDTLARESDVLAFFGRESSPSDSAMTGMVSSDGIESGNDIVRQ